MKGIVTILRIHTSILRKYDNKFAKSKCEYIKSIKEFYEKGEVKRVNAG